MNIVEIYERFPTEDKCLDYLEEIRWQGKPQCPYCESHKSTPMKKERRHHCNNCNTTYSVTVQTIFHRTRMPLQKWFLAICLILNAKKGISARQLARDLKVNKDTAWYMGMRIRRSMLNERELLRGIVEMDETYIGGKSKNRRGNTGSGGYGKPRDPFKLRMSPVGGKIPVVGMTERGGRVRAMVVKEVKGKTMKSLV